MSGPMSLYPESCRQPTHRRAPRAHRSQGALVVLAIRGRNCVPPSTLSPDLNAGPDPDPTPGPDVTLTLALSLSRRGSLYLLHWVTGRAKPPGVTYVMCSDVCPFLG